MSGVEKDKKKVINHGAGPNKFALKCLLKLQLPFIFSVLLSPAMSPDFFSRLRLRVKKIGSGITQKISTPTDKPIFCPKNGKNRFTQYQKI